MRSTRNYRIIETLGSGGTAVLYRAIQTSLDRTVVIKKLHSHLTDDPNFTKRFELEAKTAAGLEHDNIVRVFDFGVSGSSYFIVMEYVEGASLRDLLDSSSRLPIDIALILVAEILHGLEHAHSRDVVHRDIKPGNIMVSRSGRIKITDFGLAKLGANPLYQTTHDSILGTPLYMSPEQAYGESVDQRSDLFSLGTVLLELMTGAKPFLAENYTAVINKILNFEPGDIEKHMSDLPRAVRNIVLKALEKNPDRRYQHATDFREDIELYFGEAKITDRGRRLKEFLRDPKIAVERRRKERRGEEGRVDAKPVSGIKRFTVGLVGLGMMSLVLLSTFMPEWIPPLALPREDRVAAEAFSPSPGHPAVPGALPESLLADTMSAPAYPPLDEILDEAKNPTVDISGAISSVRIYLRPSISPPLHAPSVPPERNARETSEKAPPSNTRATTSNSSTGWLAMNVLPSAFVSIDGRSFGDVTDLDRVSLKSGNHRIRVTQHGYQPYEETVRIVTNELTRRTIILKKETGHLLLDAQKGASLYVDGKFTATLPLRRPLELDAGRHTLSLRMVGFNPWNANVEIRSAETLNLRIHLTPVN